MMELYFLCVTKLNWSLRDIDETNLETLMDFIFFNKSDPDIRIINGKEYRRVKNGAPSWL